MKQLMKWCSWELKNEYAACTYFTVMIIVYCLIHLLCGTKNVDILVIFEMYLVNYVLSTIEKLFFNLDKDYYINSPTKERRILSRISKAAISQDLCPKCTGIRVNRFILRAVIMSILSLIIIIIVSSLGGWFDGMPEWSGITIYTMLILSYIMVWFIVSFTKKHDTKQLNNQLENFKRNNKII